MPDPEVLCQGAQITLERCLILLGDIKIIQQTCRWHKELNPKVLEAERENIFKKKQETER